MSSAQQEGALNPGHATIIRLLARQGAEQWLSRQQKDRINESRDLRSVQQR